MRTEQVELTVLCLIHKDGSYLLQDRVKNDWNSYQKFQHIHIVTK